MDHEDAIHLTLSQTKESGELQFKTGIGVLARTELDKIKKKHYGFFDYERSPIQDNPYHGNLLLDGSAEKPRRTLIRAVLANAVEITRREDRVV